MFRGRVAGWEAYWWHDGRGEILSAYYGIDDGCIRGIYVFIQLTCLSFLATQMFSQMQKLGFFCALPMDPTKTHMECKHVSRV